MRKGINLESKNGMWKGDKVGYDSLHAWIKRRKPKITICENCKNGKVFDLANISGEYKRDVTDYEWLCRKCHMEKDGRLKLFKTYSARLTKEEVIAIRMKKGTSLTQREIGEMYGICQAHVSDILSRKKWANI